MKSALALTEAGPRLELTGEEWVYPVTLDQEGSEFKVFFHMSPYAASEMKSALTAAVPKWKRVTDDRQRLVVGESDAVKTFFDSHFLKMSGVEGGTEEQKAWLEENANIKNAVVANAMAVEVIKPEAVEGNGSRPLFQLGQKSRSVSLKLRLEESEVLTVHHFSAPVAHDYAKYERSAIHLERNDAKKELTLYENFETEEKFYDQLILRIEGTLVNGQPCEAENKSAWLKLVPFRFKSIAIDDLFRRIRVKNA